MENEYFTFLNLPLQKHFAESLRYVSTPTYISQIATSVGMHTSQINSAFTYLKSSVIQRGIQYANNTTATRGGFMAENFVAESYNLDAVLKDIDTMPAKVLGETARASPDVVYDSGEASLKFYSNAESSAKAQLNPEYENQVRIVPADQLEEAKVAINEQARRNELKGRTETAEEQRAIANKLTDRIRDEKGVESTPLTKQQDIDLADAIQKDVNGNIVVDDGKIEQVMDDTGISKRVRTTKLHNEIMGLGRAAAIGLGMGATISLVSELARVGLDSGQIGDVVFGSLAVGTESGAIAATTYVAGRGATYLLESMGLDLMSVSGYMTNFAVVGILSTAIMCAYQFAKLTIAGNGADEVLDVTKRTAFSSATLLAVSLAAQGIWGGPAGIIVSSGAGLVLLVMDTGKTIRARKIEACIREYAIEEYRKVIDGRRPIYIM